ncbi:hypothetical protein [Runella slithyformis]|uniref:Uncharacterized protein n=1 Tax=Runella slithyformis (strain ATCC 29530 / DSM 19594 / LMG 11500 / NCIMB 11436 / LSU 4) TaxID=761193 RepID=A0A7U4E503_RUNSL|nr:hypothetical protein [Runella slithyformis]AEI47683.1 hypothetical protein Runsl_1256 [Runella slithyformis DSM 19594]
MIIGFEKIAPNAPARIQLTKLYTGSDYIHAELFFESQYRAGLAARVSTKGVTLEPFPKIVEESEQWVFFRVPITDEREVWEYVQQYAGKEFSFRNIAAMVTGLSIVNPNARFCSELCYEVIRRFSLVPVADMPPHTVTPAILLEIVRNAGFERVSVTEL